MTTIEGIEEYLDHMLNRPMMFFASLAEMESGVMSALNCWEIAHRCKPALSVRDAYSEARTSRGLTQVGGLADWAAWDDQAQNLNQKDKPNRNSPPRGEPLARLTNALREVFERSKKSLPPLAQLAQAAS